MHKNVGCGINWVKMNVREIEQGNVDLERLNEECLLLQPGGEGMIETIEPPRYSHEEPREIIGIIVGRPVSVIGANGGGGQNRALYKKRETCSRCPVVEECKPEAHGFSRWNEEVNRPLIVPHLGEE